MPSFVMTALQACNEAFTTDNVAEQTEHAALLIGTMALSGASRSDAVYIEALQADNETLQAGNTVLLTDNVRSTAMMPNWPRFRLRASPVR